MLSEDTSAFVERLEVPADDKRAAKQLRRIARAELEVLETTAELRLAHDALRELEARAAASSDEAASPGRTPLRLRKARSLESEIEAIRALREAKQAELGERRQRLKQLTSQATSDEPRPAATLYRLHSSDGHVQCSERQYRRLAGAQHEVPVHVATRHGRRWWWYLDRFWWDEIGLTQREVERMVLQSDHEQRLASRARAEALKSVLAGARVFRPEHPIPEAVRRVVRRRDRDRCVDCGTEGDLAFDLIVPLSHGGSIVAPNVELRCGDCHERLARNVGSARVQQARVDAGSFRR